MRKSTKEKRAAGKATVLIPDKLHPDARAFREKIQSEYELDTLASGYLEQAVHHLSTAILAQEMLDREGMILKTKTGYRMLHPVFRVLKESSGLFARFMDLMGLDVEAPKGIGRPVGS